MLLADYMKYILDGLRFLCLLVLAFYLLKVVKSIVFGRTPDDRHRFREAMAMGYTFFGAFFILYSVNALNPFVQSVAQAGERVGSPPQDIGIFLRLCAALVCSAFICNFSRSLWMLKSLDHAVFEPVPDWETLSEPVGKRFVEFITRTVAAVLFIFLELELEKLGNSHLSETLQQSSSGTTPTSPLTSAGGYGIFLYLCLVLWWFSGLWIAKKQMPWQLLLFYLAGLGNSIFVYRYGRPVETAGEGYWLFICIAFVTILAVYMLGYVFFDVGRTLYKSIAKQQPVPEERTAVA